MKKYKYLHFLLKFRDNNISEKLEKRRQELRDAYLEAIRLVKKKKAKE